MRELLKRIAVNGLLAAVILAVIGWVMAEVATLWFTSTAPARPAGGPAAAQVNPPVQDTLRYRMPVGMAGWGFVFVAVTEVIRHLWRSTPPARQEPARAKPDTAERLLDELLAQVEAKQESGGRSQESAGDSPEPSAPNPAKEGAEPQPGRILTPDS